MHLHLLSIPVTLSLEPQHVASTVQLSHVRRKHVPGLGSRGRDASLLVPFVSSLYSWNSCYVNCRANTPESCNNGYFQIFRTSVPAAGSYTSACEAAAEHCRGRPGACHNKQAVILQVLFRRPNCSRLVCFISDTLMTL